LLEGILVTVRISISLPKQGCVSQVSTGAVVWGLKDVAEHVEP